MRYGAHPDQLADIRLPADANQRGPLLIVIHGGFWRTEYDRAHTGPLAADLAVRGYPVAQLEYRRTRQVGGGWPGTFDDVAAGVAALPGLIGARSSVNTERPVLVGHSAGGHLALWTGHAGARALTGAITPLGGILALAPIADLGRAYSMDLDAGAVAALLGGGPAERPEAYERADPARLGPIQVPAVLLHGVQDKQVPVEISRRYAAAAGPLCRLIELPDAGHYELIDPQSSQWPAVVEALSAVVKARAQLR